MRKNSLVVNSGLSLSQAQSISNLCNQAAIEIGNIVTSVNNAGKTVEINGVNKLLVKPKPIPSDIVNLLLLKSKYHACQAFLMSNIKAKDDMLKSIKSENADLSKVAYPEQPKFIDIKKEFLPNVDEEWGWEQLKLSEYNEVLEAESFAAHIGQFIHKNGVLTSLRSELVDIPSIEWMSIKEGEKIPVDIGVHHTSEQLLSIHNNLANLHREYEQRVNYFKAKVKNLVTAENARIAKHNADLQNEVSKQNNEMQVKYETAMRFANEEANKIRKDFEQLRQTRIAEVSSMRINVDGRFQSVVDEFLSIERE